MTVIGPIFVVLGLDADGKPHASRFEDDQAELATKAAGLMGFKVARVEEGELLPVAANLPYGRIFAQGKAFVPFVKREVYDKLAPVARTPEPIAEPVPPTSDPTEEQPTSGRTEEQPATADPVETEQPEADAGPAPDPWREIAVGSVVLATAGRDDGWWEAEVQAVDPSGEHLTLKWRDFPGYARFTRHRSGVALLPPKAA